MSIIQPAEDDRKLTPIQRIEKSLELKSCLEEMGYSSVFDIVRQTKNTFIKQNNQRLGARVEPVYDLAIGQAQHIRRLFRKNQLTSRIQNALPQTLSGVSLDIENYCTLRLCFDLSTLAGLSRRNLPEAGIRLFFQI